jgi:hypothetical protein
MQIKTWGLHVQEMKLCKAPQTPFWASPKSFSTWSWVEGMTFTTFLWKKIKPTTNTDWDCRPLDNFCCSKMFLICRVKSAHPQMAGDGQPAGIAMSRRGLNSTLTSWASLRFFCWWQRRDHEVDLREKTTGSHGFWWFLHHLKHRFPHVAVKF